VASCNFCQSNPWPDAWHLLALCPTLHRLTNWLLRQNEDRAKKDVIMRGGLLALSGQVESTDRQYPHWRDTDFEGAWTWNLNGRVLGARFHYLIKGRTADNWSCDCDLSICSPPRKKQAVDGIKSKDACCRHEVAWWLTAQTLKRDAAQAVAGAGMSLGFCRVLPTPSTVHLCGADPVDQSYPYQVWRNPGGKVKGKYRSVTYCLVRPFDNGVARRAW
jgi:hypothetical protein